MAKSKGVTAKKSAERSKGHTVQQPNTTKKDIGNFVKGFYEKNGKAMTQLAYE